MVIYYFIQVIILLFLLFIPHEIRAQTPTIRKYEVLELTYTYTSSGMPNNNPWEDSNGSYVTADFFPPSGNKITIEGFYFDTNTYKVRFTPAETGDYRYLVTLRDGPDGNKSYSGSFTVLNSSHHGFIRRNPHNPSRLQFEDGAFFNGVGINDCWGEPSQPEWFMKASIDENVSVDPDLYMKTYSEAGFNLFRWNPGNCSFGIYNLSNPNGNAYQVFEGKSGDQLLSSAKKYGFHTLFTFWWGPPSTNISDTDQTQMMKRTINYALARYGAYIDMWELTNEQDDSTTDVAWLNYYANYLRDKDPYKRLVTNSHPINTDWTVLDFRSPHPELYDGYQITKSATNNFTIGIPVIVGEGYTAIPGCGNCAHSPLNPWSVRGTVWSSIISGMGVIWWNSSFGACPGCMPHNQYLGYQERAGVKIAQDFLGSMDKDSTFQVLPSSNSDVNQGATVYGLFSSNTIWVYFLRQLHSSSSISTTTTINVPFAGVASWINPKTGVTILSYNVSLGLQDFSTPGFSQDLALRITRSGAQLPTNTPSSSFCPLKPQGDANCDGLISGLDYVIWLNIQCNPEGNQACSDTRADFNSDRRVNNEDYDIWFSHTR